MSNADETHFLSNMNNGKTLVFTSGGEVRYSDLTSRSEGMKILVRINENSSPREGPPLLIFKSKRIHYLITGVLGSVSKLSYQTGPKSLMDFKIMFKWLKESLGNRRCSSSSRAVCVSETAARYFLPKK